MGPDPTEQHASTTELEVCEECGLGSSSEDGLDPWELGLAESDCALQSDVLLARWWKLRQGAPGLKERVPTHCDPKTTLYHIARCVCVCYLLCYSFSVDYHSVECSFSIACVTSRKNCHVSMQALEEAVLRRCTSLSPRASTGWVTASKLWSTQRRDSVSPKMSSSRDWLLGPVSC